MKIRTGIPTGFPTTSSPHINLNLIKIVENIMEVRRFEIYLLKYILYLYKI